MSDITTALRNVKLVIFDWSGVISDDRLPVYEANKIVVGKYGIEIEEYIQWLLHSPGSAVEYFVQLGITQDHAILAKEFSDALANVRRGGNHPIIYPDAVAVLYELAVLHEKIFVVSKHPQNHLLKEAEEYGVAQYLTGIVGDVQDKSIAIKSILTSTELESDTVAYIGDCTYDIRSAKQAGVVSIGITTGYHNRDQLTAEHPDLIIDSLSELLTYL